MAEERVDPRVLQLKFLKDIIGELEELRKTTQSMIQEGVVEPLRDITVTTSAVVVHPPLWGEGKLWFGVKVTNDGPDSVYVIVNTGKSPPTPQEIKLNETWGVAYNTAVIEDLRLYTASGTAVVRIRGER